jgi:ATP-dependent DNA helicase RecQ
MFNLCNSAACRRKDLLRYFGETYRESSCNSCDNCLDDSNREDETVAAKKILSCVFRLENRFGIKYVIDVLRGSKIKALFDNRHDRLSTYGLMKEYSEEDLRYYIGALITMGFLERTEGEYPVLRWTATSTQVIKGEVAVMIRKQARQVVQKKEKQELHYDKELFNRLSLLRRKWAEETSVPAFVVFGDRALMEMAAVKPTSKEGLLAINGCGPIKWIKYGQSFLDVIADYCGEKKRPLA